MRVFEEQQKFNQPWVLILLAISSVMPITLVLKELIESDWKDKEAFTAFIIVMISMGLVLLLFFSLKLKTRIDENGVYYRFVPFHFKKRMVAWSEIEKIYVRKYDALSEFGGWGIKGGALWKKKNGIAYNVSGDMGLQMVLKNKKKILLGTQKETDVEKVLRTYKDKFIISN